MKVICINAGPLPGDIPDQPKLVEGNSYTVVKETIGVDDNWSWLGYCYVLREIHPMYAYQKERFIPLLETEKDETISNTVDAEQHELCPV